jgi:cytochrome c553
MNAPVLSMIFALAALSGAAQGQVGQVAGDAAAGHEKNRMCVGCHGISGWRTAYPEIYSVPMIYGQHPAYIVKALQSYKSGERSHPSMRAIAGSLSDQDMADLAAYYGAVAPTVAKK